jgi:hypothetical protein
MKDMGQTAYILGIKIYKVIFRRLFGLFQSTYIDKMLKTFIIEESKFDYMRILTYFARNTSFQIYVS